MTTLRGIQNHQKKKKINQLYYFHFQRKLNGAMAGQEMNYPMYYVSWEDIQEFLKRLNSWGEATYRLPSEAEWEFAARSGSNTPFACEGSNCHSEMGWYQDNSERKTHRVAQKKPNQWGLYDMHGNVWEWVQNSYGNSYLNLQAKVLRGGGWSYSQAYARSASRHILPPDYRSNAIGFRLVREP